MWLSGLLERWNCNLEGPSSSPTIYSGIVLGSPSFLSSRPCLQIANSFEKKLIKCLRLCATELTFEPH